MINTAPKATARTEMTAYSAVLLLLLDFLSPAIASDSFPASSGADIVGERIAAETVDRAASVTILEEVNDTVGDVDVTCSSLIVISFVVYSVAKVMFTRSVNVVETGVEFVNSATLLDAVNGIIVVVYVVVEATGVVVLGVITVAVELLAAALLKRGS